MGFIFAVVGTVIVFLLVLWDECTPKRATSFGEMLFDLAGRVVQAAWKLTLFQFLGFIVVRLCSGDDSPPATKKAG